MYSWIEQRKKTIFISFKWISLFFPNTTIERNRKIKINEKWVATIVIDLFMVVQMKRKCNQRAWKRAKICLQVPNTTFHIAMSVNSVFTRWTQEFYALLSGEERERKTVFESVLQTIIDANENENNKRFFFARNELYESNWNPFE